MRIPEPIFVVINFVVRTLLKSPLHFLMSNSVLLIEYTGRKSGKTYSTPVRYICAGSRIRCFTSEEVQWWRNVKASPSVSLRVRGSAGSYHSTILDRDPVGIQQMLSEFLSIYPQDAVYQEIGLNTDGSLNSDDLVRASHSAVVLEFEEA